MDLDEDSGGQTPSGTSQPSTRSTPQAAPNSGPGSVAVSGSGNSGAQSEDKPMPSSVHSSQEPESVPPAAHSQLSKRRRGLGVVTPNACTECRKKRAKCDGQIPCGRCRTQKDVDCVYEAPVRQSKENLRSEIETLRSRQKSNDRVFSALAQPHLWEEVLMRLRGNQSVETISDWLGGVQRSGGVLPSISAIQLDASIPAGPILPPLSSPSPIGSSGAASLSLGLSPISTQLPGLRSDLGPAVPWQYSTHSHAGPGRRGSPPDAMNWTADMQVPPYPRVGSWAETIRHGHMSETMPRFRGLEQVPPRLNEPEMKSPAGTWTNITGDMKLVQHLLALYFCWEYPTFASLSKEHFLRDFQDGVHRYCSPILVNALLALGCRFSTQPMTMENPSDPYSSGDHFFKESQRLFYRETDHHSVTTIQALGIMSIREASCGRDSESWYYAGQSVRLAIEMGLHRLQADSDDDELAVQSATFWGAFALDHAWSLATGSLPQCSCFPNLPPKPAIIGGIEASLWVPYSDDGAYARKQEAPNGPGDDIDANREGAPLQRSCEQPSNVRSVYKCFCELSELVHESLYILHSPRKPLTARNLLGMYTQYLNWYSTIPEVLRLGHNFTPAVLFAHMYYHFAILLLFRPLIKLRILGSKVYPRDVCLQAADAIQSLLKSYSQLYTLRRTPSFVPYFVLTSAIMHLAIGAAASSSQSGDGDLSPQKVESAVKLDSRVREAINQGITDLSEMAPCHHFAEQALNILKYLADKWNIDVDINRGRPDQDGSSHDGKEADMNIVQPNTSSLNFFVPNMRTEDFMCDWGTQQQMGDGAGSKSEKSEREQKPAASSAADGMRNPLFWPFPMQGRPLLPSGEELREAGFALL